MRILSLFLAVFLAQPLLAQSDDGEDADTVVTADEDAAQARQLALDPDDPLTGAIITWLELRNGAGDFDAYLDFLETHPDWPDLQRLRARAEEAIDDTVAQDRIIASFAGRAPQTGAGAERLALALIAAGRAEDAAAMLRRAWIDLSLTEEGQAALLGTFGPSLAPFHVARTDALLWRGRATEAARMLPLLDDDQRALAAARIAYQRDAADLADVVAAVPRGLAQDAGLAYARYNWLNARGDRTEAVALLADRSTSASALGEPFRWSGWRRVLARWEMREGRAEQAYRLASRHYLDDGAAFADLEWLAGYLALTYLGDPATALTHFTRAAATVSTPISVARMHYWIGRTHEVRKDAGAAAAAYALAAEHQTAFYGLLAMEKLGRALDPVWAAPPAPARTDIFEQDLTRAAFALLDAGERGAAVSSFAQIGATADPDSLALLGAALAERDEQYYTLLLGKRGVARGLMVPQNYFPLHDLAQMDLPVDPALALSIARRESEFNIGIGSPAGALGLMQLMPATAEEVAAGLDLPYSRARLTSDWAYNATLGAQYLAELQAEFGNSPVMIAAGYNAGPSRPRQWIDDRGDPRLREMDVVDWIEHIPFRETRNYVMRVTESIPIYRARLSGQTGPVAFTQLLIGEKPLLRPVARPARDLTAPRPDVRPVLRPEEPATE